MPLRFTAIRAISRALTLVSQRACFERVLPASSGTCSTARSRSACRNKRVVEGLVCGGSMPAILSTHWLYINVVVS